MISKNMIRSWIGDDKESSSDLLPYLHAVGIYAEG